MATVLVVDDDQDIRSSLRTILELAHHRVLEAQHGLEALKMVESDEPDLMLLDIIMPEMDGLETLKELRRTHHRFPIVAMPAHGTTSRAWYADVARMFGADEVLEKPFTESDVMKVLDRTVAHGS